MHAQRPGNLEVQYQWEQALCSRGQGNPAIRGFFVKQLLLADIVGRGLTALGGKNWGGRLNLVVFGSDTHTPELSISNKPQKIIFIPLTSKFMAFDAILYMSEKQKGGKMVATVVPLQVTIANKHSDSEAKFFPTWGIYEQKLSTMEHISDWQVIFLWIHDMIEAIPADKRREEAVKRSERKQKERTVLINPAYNRCLLPVRAVSKRIGQLLDISRGGSGNEACATTTMDNPSDEAGGKGEGEVQGAQVQLNVDVASGLTPLPPPAAPRRVTHSGKSQVIG